MNKELLATQQLSIERGGNQLIKQLDFSVQAGQLWQIVGANGSGKTSLLRTLCGLLPADEGKVLWYGRNIRECRSEYHSNLFYLSHALGVKQDLSVLENLRMHYRYEKFNAQKVAYLLERFDLLKHCHRLCRHLSQGQCQRVALARMLLIDVNLWLLDEPFTALDHLGMQSVQQLLLDKINRGGTVILTTHRPLTLSELPVQLLNLEQQ